MDGAAIEVRYAMRKLLFEERVASIFISTFATGLSVLTVATAWAIQTFWPYYSNSWDFNVWVGRALWLAIGLCAAGFLLDSKISGRHKILDSLLVAVLGVIGYYSLDFTTKTEAVGRYTYSTDWTSRNVDNWRQVLGPLAGKPGIRALEVGTYEGRSAVWLLENILTDGQASITCIDIFNGAYELNFDRNVKPFGGRVEKIKARSQVALRGLKPESYDLAYIDGSHVAKDVLIDAMLTWDLVKPGGLIIFDDYEWAGRFEGQAFTPQIAIDAFLNVMEPYVEIVHRGKQVVVKKRVEFNRDSRQARP